MWLFEGTFKLKYMKRHIVCIIDDSEAFRIITKITVSDYFPSEDVLVFPTVMKGIDYIKSNLGNEDVIPDVVFTDLNMPNIDGWEFIEAYKALRPLIKKDILIYFITSFVTDSDVAKASKIPEITGVINKPLDEATIQKIFELVSALDSN